MSSTALVPGDGASLEEVRSLAAGCTACELHLIATRTAVSCAPLLLQDLEPDRGRMVRVTPPLRRSLHEAKAEGRRGSWRCVIEPNTVVDDLDTETIGDRRHLDPNLVRS